MTIRETQRLFTIEEYHRMAEAGILHEDDRVELIEGKLIQMAAIGSRHAACVKRLIKLLVREVGDSGVVGAQDPVVLPDSSEPEPDVAVLRPRDDFYAAGHPVPEDVLLLIEVSETSLEYDREVKLPLYARSGVPEVWVVNLSGEEILRYSLPEGEAYAEVGRVGRGGSLASRTVPDLTLKAEDILG
jgi:Uma2 family endonuclease